MTDASPPAAWLEAEAELNARLDAVDQAVRSRLRSLDEQIGADVTAPLETLVAEAAETHRRLMETYGFDKPLDAPARPPEVLWDALTAYRSDAADMHEAVKTGLRDLDVGATLSSLYAASREALDTFAEDAPASLVRPEPEGLVESEAGDSVPLLARKLAERSRRGFRSAGRAVLNGLRAVVRKDPYLPTQRAQIVPLRALLDEHARVRLTRLVVEEQERTQTALGQAVARLEAALADWTNTILKVESSLDRPRFHTSDTRWKALPAGSRREGEAQENGKPTSELPDQRAEVRKVREAAQALDRALSDPGLAVAPHDPAVLDVVHDALRERVRRSGYDSDPVAPQGEDLSAEFANDATRWQDWHRNAVQRLAVDDLLLRLREGLLDEVEQLIQSVTEATVQPVREATAAATAELEALRAEATQACAEAEANCSATSLAVALQEILDRTLERVDHDLLATLQPISLDRAVGRAVDQARQRLSATVETIPERLTLHVRLAPERAGQPGPTAEVELRKIVAELLTEEFAARLVKSADPLRQPLFRAISDAEGVRDVVRYNLETAVEELEAAAGAGTRDEVQEAITNARELTVDGLARSAERLQELAAPLTAPWQDFVRRATETFEKGWTALRQRTNAQNLVEAQFLDFKTRVVRTAERARNAARALDARAEHTLLKFLRLGRREAKRLVEMGQAAAGLAAQSASDRQRTLDALADASTIHADLPLVYRRLFAFAPVTDPSLFVDRTAQLSQVANQFERWQHERDASALVVTAMAGGGRTSFVNVLQETTLAEADVAEVSLSGRVTSTDDLALSLGEALGIEATSARTLDMLEAYLLADKSAERRRVCVVEQLEHLILRTANGLDLLERTLIFMSRTDSRVFWVATAVESGWQFVERTAPQITGLVDAVVLPTLTRDEIEEILMRRHTRSGLPLVFAEPEVPSALLARRLGKAQNPEERQAILRSEFFDGLFRASGPHPLLALLYWLRAADFEAAADTLTLRPVRPLDFGFVTHFDLPRAFALKALLQHGSLTLEEHDRIFRTTREESFLLFESLHNLRLIQRADEALNGLDSRRNGESTEAPEPVVEGARYRLHPLAVAPISDALRARNML